MKREVRDIRTQIEQHLSNFEDTFQKEIRKIELENIQDASKEETQRDKLVSQVTLNQTILEKELPYLEHREYIERFEMLSQSTNDLVAAATNYGSSQNKKESLFALYYWISSFWTECKTFGKVITEVSKKKLKYEDKAIDRQTEDKNEIFTDYIPC